MLEEFIAFVLRAKKIPLIYKLIITLQLSTGSRVSEVLKLCKSDLKFKDDKGIALIKVLKKRVKNGSKKVVYRAGAIHHSVIPLLQEYINSIEGDELFTLARESVWRKYKTMFGITPHALRHSWITYLFEVKHWDLPKVFTVMCFEEYRTVLKYQTLNVEKDAWEMF